MSLKSARILMAVLAPLVLLGCNTQIPICPVPAILGDTASRTIFRPGTQPDLANELYTVQAINAESTCTYNRKEGTTTSSLNLTFRAVRPPSNAGAVYSMPFFVVVSENAKLYDKKVYNLNFSFAPGATTTLIKQSPDDVTIRIANGKLPWNYQLMVGLQVSAADIDFNKKMGRYVQ